MGQQIRRARPSFSVVQASIRCPTEKAASHDAHRVQASLTGPVHDVRVRDSWHGQMGRVVYIGRAVWLRCGR